MTFRLSVTPLLAGAAVLFLSACNEQPDLDFRGVFGANGPSTASAARSATAKRPEPDTRGIISYPGYQVAVARRGDTALSLARRIGADPAALARYNGIQTGDPLREGEVVALPGRVAEPLGGPIQPPSDVDITSLAGNALDNAQTPTIESSSLGRAPQVGVEPLRHKVERGETAFTIARLYNVSIRSLASWNGLGSDFAVREGQVLLIPVAPSGSKPAPFDATEVATTTLPGTGSPTPTPPSAVKPLPTEKTQPRAAAAKPTAAPDLGTTRTASKSRMGYPVQGDIVREYVKGKNDGIDIASTPGATVKAAADGVVAAITEDTNGVPIIVVKHPDNLLTVYSNVGRVAVSKGDSVKRGQKLAQTRREGSTALHFEVRDGFESVDPVPFLG